MSIGPARGRVAAYLAIGIGVILFVTIVPPVLYGLFKPLCPAYVDFVKWLITVEVAALGPAFGFYFSEERKYN